MEGHLSPGERRHGRVAVRHVVQTRQLACFARDNLHEVSTARPCHLGCYSARAESPAKRPCDSASGGMNRDRWRRPGRHGRYGGAGDAIFMAAAMQLVSQVRPNAPAGRRLLNAPHANGPRSAPQSASGVSPDRQLAACSHEVCSRAGVAPRAQATSHARIHGGCAPLHPISCISPARWPCTAQGAAACTCEIDSRAARPLHGHEHAEDERTCSQYCRLLCSRSANGHAAARAQLGCKSCALRPQRLPPPRSHCTSACPHSVSLQGRLAAGLVSLMHATSAVRRMPSA